MGTCMPGAATGSSTSVTSTSTSSSTSNFKPEERANGKGKTNFPYADPPDN